MKGLKSSVTRAQKKKLDESSAEFLALLILFSQNVEDMIANADSWRTK